MLIPRTWTFAFVVIVGMTSVVAVTGCSGLGSAKQPTEWVGASSTQAAYISWADTNGHLKGSMEIATGSAAVGTSQLVSTTTIPVAGTESDGKISLDAGGIVFTAPLTGTITNDALTFQVVNAQGGDDSLRFTPGDVQSFRTSVATLNRSMAQQQSAATEAAAKTQALATLSQGESAIAADLSSVEGDLSSLSAATTSVNASFVRAKSEYTTAMSSKCVNSTASQTALNDLQNAADAAQNLTSTSLDLDASNISADITTLQGVDRTYWDRTVTATLATAVHDVTAASKASQAATALAAADDTLNQTDRGALYNLNGNC